MNYSGGTPEWHQYNTSQTNEAIPSTQNVNSGHLAFISGVGPPMNAINLNSESLNKHQNDTNFNPRNYQSYNNVSNGPNISNNSPLSSMVQMQNCIGHYATPNTRNPMLDNMNTSVDPRNASIGTINDESGYRSNQVSFHGAIGHLNGPSCNLNASSGSGSGSGARINSGSGIGTNPGNGTGPMFNTNPRHGHVTGHGSNPGNMGPRNTNIGSVASSGKPPSSFMPCKAACCNSDPNINYQQWEKFGSYQNSATYRDNIHPSGYQMENRHFGNNCNFRKDNLEGKEVMGPTLPNTSAVDPRRNFMDYNKYHKDHLMHRNYSTNSGMFHNYPMQNYNYPTEHQKYAYPMKEHAKTNNMNITNSTMHKHQEQNFIAQQKFNNKQFHYQNGNMLPKVSTLNANMAASSQNAYFNSQFPRNVSTEMSHDCQETTDNTTMVNRMQSNYMHGSSPQHQMYHHKIAMQKFSIENHLRELSRMPGYLSHPKYKECLHRYKEIVKLQQSSSYQNPIQEAPRIPTPVNATVPPINLQFDQNGMLINSSYVPDSFSKLQHASVVERAAESVEKQNEDQTMEKRQQSQQPEQIMISQQNEHVPSSCAKTGQKQNQYAMHKDFNQNQLKVQTSESHNFGSLSGNSGNETTIGQKVSKEFANKPNLDVRQFLANWDETDDEEGATNLSNTVLSETTPVVVVSFENIDIASKTPQDAEAPRKSSFCSSEILESAKEDEADGISTQGLTISYSSSSDNIELAKMSKRTIGEGVVKPGSIIHCISNGPDEIPTIHIVDNLEISNILGASNDQVIQTLEKQKSLSFFRESSNNEAEEMVLESSEQQDKNDTTVLPANYGEPLDDINKEESNISETIQTNDQELRTLSTSPKNNLDTSVNMELKKQHIFEESHNPDDISLPDLPTSECTPISTTLNTPIHSDAEESQNMEDLSISTNPIEVMQNSPVISFTQLNSEEKVKNRTLGSLELEFQKKSRYKNSENNVSHEQEVTLGNFDFSSKAKPGETIKNRHVKILGTNVARKKVFLIDAKESDSRISNTPGILTSMEYELEVQQESPDDEKSPNRDDSTREEKHKNMRRSREAIARSSDSIENLSSIESGDESKIERNPFKRRKIKTSTGSISLAETEASVRKTSEDKYLDKKGNSDHSRSKSFDAKKLDNSQQSEEHSVCHMTCKYKKYSVAVIKDNVTLSDKNGTTDRTMNEKSIEFPSKTINTKEQAEETETRKHASSKAISVLQETSKLLQKDLKTVDGDVRYTEEEMRLLKEYGKKKDKLHHDTHSDSSRDEKTKCKSSFHHRNKLECSQIKQNSEVPGSHKACLEENSVSSAVNLNFQNSEMQEEARGQFCSKSFIQNADFGIQVANVNLKIKENDVGKELILESKSQEHTKDSLDTIKIEINVSCTDRNLKGQEQNKRLLYEDRNLFEIDYSPSCTNTLDSQHRLHTRTHEEQTHRASVTETNQINDEVDLNSSNTLGKDRRSSIETNEEIGSIVPKEQCGLDSQSFKSSKDTSSTEAIEVNNFSDLIKSKSAISNTAIVYANINKVKGKFEREKEDDLTSVDDNRTDILIENSKKLPENSLAEPIAKSLHDLDTNSDSNIEKLEYKNSHSNRSDEESIEEEYTSKWKKPKIEICEDCDMLQSSSGYVNPLFLSIDKVENPYTVPVYTTKDGKISYSPNHKFIYHELTADARKRESSARKSHHVDDWSSYKFIKMCKRKRCHLSDRRKHDYKDTKCLYDRKRNYSDEFYNKSYKCKDYVRRNNNAVWFDHYSDSEEITERSKHRVAEMSTHLKEWHENEAALLESNCENTNKDNTADSVLTKDTNQEEIQSINKEHEDCKSDDKNTSLQLKNEEKSNVVQIESLAVNNLSENSENRSLNNECSDAIIDKIDSKIISENERNISSENESTISKLLKEDENKEEHTLCNFEEKKNDMEIVSEEKDNNEQKEEMSIISGSQNSFLEAENSSEHIETTNENLESNENNKPVTETEMTKEILEPQVNFENFDSQEFLEPEVCDNTSTVKYDENNIINGEENVSGHSEEIIQFGEEIEVPNDDQTQEENTNNDTEENIQVLDYQNDDSSKHIPTLNQEESQMTQINVTVDQQNDLEHNSMESEINMSMNSDQLNKDEIIEEQNFTGFEKYEIPSEAVIIFDKNEMVSLSIEEIPEESDIDSLKNNFDDPPKLSEQESNPSRKNSEEELPVLSKHSSIENFSHLDSENSQNKAEDGEQNSLEIPCKISNYSSENNTDVKTLPKLVIKKTDASNLTPECSMDYTDSSEKYDEKLLSEVRPKIPKMIIMKNRSRSATPVVEILEKNKSDNAQSTLERNDEENSDSKSSTLKYHSYENKIPKVKIKLEEISSKDLKLYLKRKASKNNIPKLKIKKMKPQERMESESSSGTDDSEDEDKNIRDSMNNETEKLPKLKYRKQEEDKSSLSEQNQGKDFSILKISSKKSNRRKEEDSTAKCNKTNDDELKKKFPQCIIEKIPKVIIKRTQIGTKFKCEISKSKKTSVAETSKWQPKVKLQRLEALDHMVKNLNHLKMTFKGKLNVLESKSDINDKKDQIHDSKTKLCRSNSASNLSPVKCKHRRLSDSDCVKMDLQSANNFSDYVDDKIINFELDNNGTDLKRKERRTKSFIKNRQDDSESDEDETEAKHSFKNILMNENKDARVHKEYSSFGTKESVPFIENKFLNSSRFDDEERSIIEIDSSDESETTIEILPASPDNSEDEEKDDVFDDTSGINEDDAIPTQLELEMELIDKNNMDSETAPEMNRASHSKKESDKTYFDEFPRSSKNTSDQKTTESRNYFYCNDLLVKEVLAAKETLKKCLTLSENEDILQKGLSSKTQLEKKQILGFNFTDLRRSLSKSHSNNVNKSRNSDKKSESPSNLQERIYSMDCSMASTCGDSNVPESTTISLKTLKQFSRITTNANSSRESHANKSEKKVNSNLEDRKDNDSSSEAKTKEDNMPLLVPEFALSFDSSLDRDSSRSPPVITNQEESEQAIENTKLMEGKAINQNGEVGEDKKDSYKDREMTIADIITQLAYHETATIRHERYCNLCERWFTSTSRHRRHLAGYQHRYIELTQRKSIHALFILFTGKPCPRLLPPHIIRNDCSIGEMTPLQIAVQDIAIFDTQQDHKTKE